MAKISSERIGEILRTALIILKENGGQLPSRSVPPELEKRIDFTDYEKATLEKTGNVRWQSILHFYSIDVQKAGWLVKKGGIWYLTPEGEQQLSLTNNEFILKANQAYKSWRESTKSEIEKTDISIDKHEDVEEVSERLRFADYEQAKESARQRIVEYINDADPYEFQDMVGALLRGMGYHTPFIAPRGKDGGVDIIAYRDPLGVQPPRMKVQVKHRESTKATVQEINQLIGVLNQEDVGLFVCTGGFTPDASSAIRMSRLHVEKIDLDYFIDLWVEYYDKMSEEDKGLIPLRKIHFLAPTE